MLANVVDLLLLKKMSSRSRDSVIESAFYFFNGIFMGVLLNDAFRMFAGPEVNKQPFSLFPGIMTDEGYQYFIAIGVVSSGILPYTRIYNKWTNNVALGLGMAAGSFYANRSEAGDYIGLVKVPK